MPRRNTYVGVRDAAATLGLSVPRVKQLAAQGRVGRMVAGRYLFTPDELDKFLAIPRPCGRKQSKSA